MAAMCLAVPVWLIRSTASVVPSPIRLPYETAVIGSRGVAVRAESWPRRSVRLPSSSDRTAARSTSARGKIDEVGVAADGLELALLVSPQDVRGRDAAALLQLSVDVGRVVHAEHDEIAGARPIQRAAGGLHLVKHDLGTARPGKSLRNRALHTLEDEP